MRATLDFLGLHPQLARRTGIRFQAKPPIRSLAARMAGASSPFRKSAAIHLSLDTSAGCFFSPGLRLGSPWLHPDSQEQETPKQVRSGLCSAGADSSHATCVRGTNMVKTLAKPRKSLNETPRPATWPVRAASHSRWSEPQHICAPIHDSTATHPRPQRQRDPTLPQYAVTTLAHAPPSPPTRPARPWPPRPTPASTSPNCSRHAAASAQARCQPPGRVVLGFRPNPP